MEEAHRGRASGEPQRDPDRPKGSLLRGAAVLGAAAILSKLLGTLQKIPLQNLAGDEAFGIYNAVYPLYILILFVASAGFPVTVSKFVSERLAVHDHAGAKRIVYVSSALLMSTGIGCFLLLYLGAGEIASWIGIEQTERAIRSVSFALLVSPVMAVLRGYFQGYQQMVPTAVSQVMEQLIRVITMVSLLLYYVSFTYSAEWIAAGATFGSVTGAAAGLIVMLVYWQKDRQRRALPRRVKQPAGSKDAFSRLAGRIIAYAIPICLGSIVMPILTLVDTFTMPRLLEGIYHSEAEAMRQFGLYNRGLPLVQLVVMIASSMSAALVPAIAEARMQGQAEQIRSRAETAVRLSWLIGLAASFGLAVAAVPINMMLYKTSEASLTMSMLAFTALFSTLNAVTASVLQGAGAVRTPAVNLLIAAALKALGNVWLMPRWGIEGAALSAVIAFAFAAGLNMVQVARCTGVRFALRQYALGPGAAVGLMSVCLAALQLAARPLLAAGSIPERWSYSAIALVSVAGGAAVYALALLRSGSISREELRLVPKLDRKLMPVLERLRLMPAEKQPPRP